MDPHNGVRVVEAELNVTRNELDRVNLKYSCECYAWNSKGKIRSQGVLIEYACKYCRFEYFVISNCLGLIQFELRMKEYGALFCEISFFFSR